MRTLFGPPEAPRILEPPPTTPPTSTTPPPELPRGEGPIDEALREPIGAWFLGCDLCQDVCPFNRTHAEPGSLARELAPHPRWGAHDAASLLAMSEQDFDTFSLGSPVRRPGHEGARRNAAIVLGNRGERRHLPVLREVATSDASATVREAARWGADRIDRG